jgi:hypothetical protein
MTRLEMELHNTGLCPIETLFGTLEIPGGYLVHKWNYDNVHEEIRGFGRNLTSGAISYLHSSVI